MSWCAALGTRIAAAAVFAAAVAAVFATAGAASVPPAYCSLPSGPANPSWAFHAGAPILAGSGTYAHGHGTLSAQHVTGQICQVDRTAGSPDRQVILSVHGAATPQHAVTVHGVLGNRIVLPVRVSNSTDPRCRVGTKGNVTVFSSYNGVHRDSLDFAFPRACRDHDHHYSGPHVVALVPA